jgi:hypothetical protein
VQPNRRGAGAAVVQEGDGASAGVFDVAADVGGGVDDGGRFAFVVFEEHGLRDGLVGNALPSEFDGVVGNGRFFFGSGAFRLFVLVGGFVVRFVL